MNITNNNNLCEMICTAYELDINNEAVRSVKNLILNSKKYSFPFVCSETTINNHDLLSNASKLLLEVGSSWPHSDIPNNFFPTQNSSLMNDAKFLVSSVKRNMAEDVTNLHRETFSNTISNQIL